MNWRFASVRRPRWGTLLLVALLHLVVLAGLVRVFAPDFTARVVERASSLATVTISAPPDPPAPAEPDALAREPPPPARPRPRPSPVRRAAWRGVEAWACAGEQGAGTGSGGTGEGRGSGVSGSGRGNAARPLELISGRIDDARDYPTP